jgi:hypothetical protein
MTRGQRRTWLALEEQKRRRARGADASPAPAILLISDGHGRLIWTLNFTTDCDNINIYLSDDGVTWGTDAYDGWFLSAGARECTGVPGYFRICVCDPNGQDVPPYSNVVYSDGLEA